MNLYRLKCPEYQVMLSSRERYSVSTFRDMVRHAARLAGVEAPEVLWGPAELDSIADRLVNGFGLEYPDEAATFEVP